MESVFVRNYGIIPGSKDRMLTLRLRQLLDKYRSGEGTEFVFEEGCYHFYPDYAVEKTLKIPNHDEDSLKKIAFDLTEFSHAVIRGQNTEFIFHSEILPFYLYRCQEVCLKGFSVDYERPAYSEGTIISSEKDRMCIYIDREQYPYHVNFQRLFFTGENYCYEPSGWMEVDSSLDGPARNAGELGFSAENAGDYVTWKELEDRLLEVRPADGIHTFEHYKPGNLLILRHHPRSYPGIYIAESKKVYLQDIALYHCAGMGVIAQFTEDISLERVKVTDPPGHRRWFSLAADAAHFVYCRGTISLKNCLFEHQLDDAVNIHGVYARVKEFLSDRELLVELVHHQQKGVPVGNAGDRISFVDHQTMLSVGEGVLREVNSLNKDFCYLRFMDPVPNIRQKDVIENISYVPDVWIESCTVRNNRARGILLTTAGNVMVRNNTFHTSGAAILVSGDCEYWFESGATKHIVVENNLFDHCNYVKKWGKAVIQVDSGSRLVRSEERIHQYLEIRNNRFYGVDGPLVNARNLKKLVFAGNTVCGSKEKENLFVLEDVPEFIDSGTS